MRLLLPNWKIVLKGIFVFLCLDPLLLNVYRCTACLFSRVACTAEGSISLAVNIIRLLTALCISNKSCRLFYFCILTNGAYCSLAIRTLQQNSDTPFIFLPFHLHFKDTQSIIKPVMLTQKSRPTRAEFAFAICLPLCTFVSRCIF